MLQNSRGNICISMTGDCISVGLMIELMLWCIAGDEAIAIAIDVVHQWRCVGVVVVMVLHDWWRGRGFTVSIQG